MKKLLAFALTAGLSLSLFAADIFKYAPITGNVKAYTETDFTIATRFGTLYRTPSSKIMHIFDSNGKETTSSELTPKDAVINTISTTYDTAGNLVEQLCTSADGEVVWKNTYAYKNGLKVDASEYDRKGNLRARTIYTYENNLLADESSYDGEGALIWKTIYKYDDNNRIASVNEYNPDGSLGEKLEYNYTDSGAIDTIAKYDAFAGTQSSMVFRYATNGSLSEITTYDANKQVTKRTLIKYDAKGNANKVSEYSVAEKFGTTVNELTAMSEYTFEYVGGSADAK
ncbi:hypothetical protein SAMN04487775_101312 [Treponema bryantii]|jgi:hypothetical protein|uniref:YD repeat-containing protein n=1 Tax=Treponema bryantii TaxID=163 RepID=A0A1I3I464_9SPIR|nr:hypothetical protein [Treponema bryantii]SFI42756.1 hypothetical protein SAMN04487775_101312 [Treponema bryantii]